MVHPIVGVHRLPSCGPRFGGVLALVSAWIAEMVERHSVADVCFESPFIGGHGNVSPEVTRRMCSLADHIDYACFEHEVRCREVTAHTWRQRFMGVSQAPKTVIRKDRRKWIKQRAMDACAARHWDVKSDDEADACGILDFCLACDDEAYRNRTARQPALEFGGAA